MRRILLANDDDDDDDDDDDAVSDADADADADADDAANDNANCSVKQTRTAKCGNIADRGHLRRSSQGANQDQPASRCQLMSDPRRIDTSVLKLETSRLVNDNI